MAGLAGVRLAVGTLTVLPAGPVRVDRRVAGVAMVLAPLAVLPVAVVAAGIGWLGQRAGGPALLGGLVVVAALALGTRAIHLDGLADTVDGLGSGKPRDAALEIMRRGDVGPMGVVALVLVLGLQSVAFGALTGTWRGALAAVLVICSSRAALALLCVASVPAARAEGLGAAVAGSVSRPAAVTTWLAVLGALALAHWLVDGRAGLGLVVGAAGGLLVWILGQRCVRRLGGVTGDVLGAGVELCLTGLVVGLAL